MADLLGTLHGSPRVADVIWLEGHHGLHFQHGGVNESVVHALVYSTEGGHAVAAINTLRAVCKQEARGQLLRPRLHFDGEKR